MKTFKQIREATEINEATLDINISKGVKKLIMIQHELGGLMWDLTRTPETAKMIKTMKSDGNDFSKEFKTLQADINKVMKKLEDLTNDIEQMSS